MDIFFTLILETKHYFFIWIRSYLPWRSTLLSFQCAVTTIAPVGLYLNFICLPFAPFSFLPPIIDIYSSFILPLIHIYFSSLLPLIHIYYSSLLPLIHIYYSSLLPLIYIYYSSLLPLIYTYLLLFPASFQTSHPIHLYYTFHPHFLVYISFPFSPHPSLLASPFPSSIFTSPFFFFSFPHRSLHLFPFPPSPHQSLLLFPYFPHSSFLMFPFNSLIYYFFLSQPFTNLRLYCPSVHFLSFLILSKSFFPFSFFPHCSVFNLLFFFFLLIFSPILPFFRPFFSPHSFHLIH